ncbi:aldo/keto reductase [Mycetocola manganoxydans]|uniref:Aldo/keto reductase n=1 Tax=Mycetocola manganoxydans TaxID=699879 RepID=A0A3L7A1R2_9MICO|nr:aldo/keto reductase [Mycetocola manganoxydans]RLP73948.1 aldo/keto reductase [Mycetocola manganoxydans]GHD42191.1 aldo/keto reductase [Mycetocola manganoxydans]
MQTAIPPLILGTMTFGDTADEASAADLVQTALDAGIAWFDTANSYSDGRSEEILGSILGARDDVSIATKVGQPQSLVGTESLLSAGKIRTSVDASLTRLGREHIEILYLHKPDRSTPLEETLTEIAALAADGKVGAFGVSNYAAWQISDVVRIAAEVGAPPVLLSQQMYSLLARRLEDEYEEYATTTGLPTVIYNPLAGGLLTGRYRQDADAGSGRFGDARNAREYRARYWDDRMFAAVDALTVIADDAGIPLAEFALRWTIGRPAVQSVLLGGTRVSHLRDNIAAFNNGPLPADVSAAADAVGDDLRGPMPAYNR